MESTGSRKGKYPGREGTYRGDYNKRRVPVKGIRDTGYDVRPPDESYRIEEEPDEWWNRFRKFCMSGGGTAPGSKTEEAKKYRWAERFEVWVKVETARLDERAVWAKRTMKARGLVIADELQRAFKAQARLFRRGGKMPPTLKDLMASGETALKVERLVLGEPTEITEARVSPLDTIEDAELERAERDLAAELVRRRSGKAAQGDSARTENQGGEGSDVDLSEPGPTRFH